MSVWVVTDEDKDIRCVCGSAAAAVQAVWGIAETNGWHGAPAVAAVGDGTAHYWINSRRELYISRHEVKDA